MTTAKDLEYNGYTSVLLRYENGEQALWVRDDYLANRSDTPGTYSLCDTNLSVPLGSDEDIDEVQAEWAKAVEWEEETHA